RRPTSTLFPYTTLFRSLAIYSHMVSEFLYLPDYPIGHLIAFQLEQKLRHGDFGAQFERAASFGRVTPDLWMEYATGSPLSAKPRSEEHTSELQSRSDLV